MIFNFQPLLWITAFPGDSLDADTENMAKCCSEQRSNIHCEWEFCKDFVGFGIVQHLSHRREIMHKLLYTHIHTITWAVCVCVCCSSHPNAEIMHTAIQIGFTLLSWGKIQSATGSTIWVNCSLDSTIVTGGRSQVCFTVQHHHLFCWEFLLILPFSCYWNGTHEHPNSQCTYWPRSK